MRRALNSVERVAALWGLAALASQVVYSVPSQPSWAATSLGYIVNQSVWFVVHGVVISSVVVAVFGPKGGWRTVGATAAASMVATGELWSIADHIPGLRDWPEPVPSPALLVAIVVLGLALTVSALQRDLTRRELAVGVLGTLCLAWILVAANGYTVWPLTPVVVEDGDAWFDLLHDATSVSLLVAVVAECTWELTGLIVRWRVGGNASAWMVGILSAGTALVVVAGALTWMPHIWVGLYAATSVVVAWGLARSLDPALLRDDSMHHAAVAAVVFVAGVLSVPVWGGSALGSAVQTSLAVSAMLTLGLVGRTRQDNRR